MRLLAPAKINLHLRVGPLSSDGYHPLLTWMCTVALFDALTLSPQTPPSGANAGRLPLVLTCDDPRLPCDGTNLVAKAARALADWAGIPAPAVSIALQKRIPHGAGLGGGSSDGARVMLGLDRLWGTAAGPARLAEWAAAVGSDLPFFFFGPSSVCTGRGEFVRPVPPPARAKWALLLLPDLAMPTAAVYRQFDQMGLGRGAGISNVPDWQTIAASQSKQLLAQLVNDLEPAAFAIAPALAALRETLERELSRPVRMSGSGSSLFTLYDDAAEVSAAAVHVGAWARQQANGVPLCNGLSVRPVELCPAIADDLAAAGDNAHRADALK